MSKKKLYKKVSKLYVIKCYDDKESFIKIGITNYDVTYRFKDLPYRFKILYVVTMKKPKIEYYESLLHRRFLKYSYKPIKYFSGYTECFKGVDDDRIKKELIYYKNYLLKNKQL